MKRGREKANQLDKEEEEEEEEEVVVEEEEEVKAFPTPDELRNLAQIAKETRQCQREKEKEISVRLFTKIFARGSRIFAKAGCFEWAASIQSLRESGVFGNPAHENEQINAIVTDLNQRGFQAKYEKNSDNEYLPRIVVSWANKKSKKK